MGSEYFQDIFSAIDKYRPLIYEAERHIWRNPEVAFREWKTSAYLGKEFEKLGYKITHAGNIPGFYTDKDTGRPGPKILIFGELDSLICRDHPDADPETGAVHACGHNAQCAALLGIAAALNEKGVLDGLCGSIRLCAVPAEETVDVTYKENLRRSGVICYYSGKAEFLYRGYFDNVDIAVMVHAAARKNGFEIHNGCNGNIKKCIIYKGVASHAGELPQRGINALYAANLGLNAINALRETFIDEEHIRVHPIITKGGEAVNAIPAEVVLETFIRGLSIDAIFNINKKVNRAIAGSAASLGARAIIIDRYGASPLVNDKNLMEIAKTAMKEIVSETDVEIHARPKGSSTDMGDISAVIPSFHPHTAGSAGTLHGNDFIIENPEKACMNPAKMMLAMVKLLLSDGASKGREVLEKKDLRYPTKEAFFKSIDRFMLEKEAVVYNEDGSVVLLKGFQF